MLADQWVTATKVAQQVHISALSKFLIKLTETAKEGRFWDNYKGPTVALQQPSRKSPVASHDNKILPHPLYSSYRRAHSNTEQFLNAKNEFQNGGLLI